MVNFNEQVYTETHQDSKPKEATNDDQDMMDSSAEAVVETPVSAEGGLDKHLSAIDNTVLFLSHVPMSLSYASIYKAVHEIQGIFLFDGNVLY